MKNILILKIWIEIKYNKIILDVDKPKYFIYSIELLHKNYFKASKIDFKYVIIDVIEELYVNKGLLKSSKLLDYINEKGIKEKFLKVCNENKKMDF